MTKHSFIGEELFSLIKPHLFTAYD